MSAQNSTAEPDRDDEHLAELGDGCGCAEVWERLSERRRRRRDD